MVERVSGRRALVVALTVLASALAWPAGAAAQEPDSSRARPTPLRPEPARVAAADTAAPDTTAADTVPNVRDLALARLRALPTSPIQPDSLAADSLAADSLAADSLAADSLAADSLAAGAAAPAPSGVDTVVIAAGADTLRGEAPARAIATRAAPGDTAAVDSAGLAPTRVGEAGVASTRPGESADVDVVLSADSVVEMLKALPGYLATEYTGEAAVFQADSDRLRLTGASNVAREGNSLATDSLLVYAGSTGVVCGYGNPVLTGAQQSDPVESDRVCYDLNRDVGEASGARTKFEQGATWYVRGAQNRVYVLADGPEKELYGTKTEFTSCDLPQPHYTFEAKSLKMVSDHVMVARDVTLKFEDVPVFWLPWMVQSMKPDRRSGLLMPQFGVNDIVRNGQGYHRRISNLGFFWAINDYVSAQTTLDWFAGNYTALQGAFSYKVMRQFLQGNVQAKEYWRSSETGGGSRAFTLNTSNSWQPDERTRVNVTGQYASSTDFVRQNSFDPNELNRNITFNAGVQRSFSWGSSTFGYSRRQDLNTGREETQLPTFSLSVSPKTLYSNSDGTLSLTWNGSANASRRFVNVAEAELPGASLRDQEDISAAANQSISFGNLSLSQRVNYTDNMLGVKPPVFVEGDTIGNPSDTLFAESTQRLTWSNSIGYQQRLWTGTQITPSLSVSGEQVMIDSIGRFVSKPAQLSTQASLSTTIFGFWPGFAGFSRIRHKISPTLSWAYRPGAHSSALQDSVFGALNMHEANTLTLSFNQTFEAKIASSDTVSTDTASASESGEPRRLPQAKKITLLSLQTSGPFGYDFVAAREGRHGFTTSAVTNTLSSDLLKGLSVRFTHDLFDEGPLGAGDQVAPRRFSPFLTNVSASFSIDNNFWLFRALGFSAGSAATEEEEPEPAAEEATKPQDLGGDGGSVVPGGASAASTLQPGGVGGWRADLGYSLSRYRPDEGRTGNGSQMLQARVSFKPTEHWSVNWTTDYSFTDHEFTAHNLTLTRDLHRWQANFTFTKAQNGNFAMTFRVELRDNPDLKMDYNQRTDVTRQLP